MSTSRWRGPAWRRPATRRQMLWGMVAGVGAAAAFTVTRNESGDDPSELRGVDRPSTFHYQRPDGPVDVLPPRRVFYRDADEGAQQTFGDFYLPASINPSMPVVVLVHGGGWSKEQSLEYMGKLAEDLASFDVAVWNIEYRRTGDGGGWPTTVQDVCDAVDHLPKLNEQMGGRLNLDAVSVCGHSSGGHLALWIAGRSALPANMPGANIRQHVSHCVSLAGVADLVKAEESGDRYLKTLLDTTLEDDRKKFVDASPVTHLPTGVSVVAIHGEKDDVVLPAQSEEYVSKARAAGDEARLEIVPGGNHDPWTDIRKPAWKRVRTILLTQLGVPGAHLRSQDPTVTAPLSPSGSSPSGSTSTSSSSSSPAPSTTPGPLPG